MPSPPPSSILDSLERLACRRDLELVSGGCLAATPALTADASFTLSPVPSINIYSPRPATNGNTTDAMNAEAMLADLEQSARARLAIMGPSSKEPATVSLDEVSARFTCPVSALNLEQPKAILDQQPQCNDTTPPHQSCTLALCELNDTTAEEIVSYASDPQREAAENACERSDNNQKQVREQQMKEQREQEQRKIAEYMLQREAEIQDLVQQTMDQERNYREAEERKKVTHRLIVTNIAAGAEEMDIEIAFGEFGRYIREIRLQNNQHPQNGTRTAHVEMISAKLADNVVRLVRGYVFGLKLDIRLAMTG